VERSENGHDSDSKLRSVDNEKKHNLILYTPEDVSASGKRQKSGDFRRFPEKEKARTHDPGKKNGARGEI
jgi:hypothetical protein